MRPRRGEGEGPGLSHPSGKMSVEDGMPGQVVCFETFRRALAAAKVLPYLAPTQRVEPMSPFRGVDLTADQVEHRSRMLEHLTEVADAKSTNAVHK